MTTVLLLFKHWTPLSLKQHSLPGCHSWKKKPWETNMPSEESFLTFFFIIYYLLFPFQSIHLALTYIAWICLNRKANISPAQGLEADWRSARKTSTALTTHTGLWNNTNHMPQCSTKASSTQGGLQKMLADSLYVYASNCMQTPLISLQIWPLHARRKDIYLQRSKQGQIQAAPILVTKHIILQHHSVSLRWHWNSYQNKIPFFDAFLSDSPSITPALTPGASSVISTPLYSTSLAPVW